MSQSVSVKQPKPVCQHKPGEKWADGCCTSRHESKISPEESLATTEDTNTQANVSQKDESQESGE